MKPSFNPKRPTSFPFSHSVFLTFSLLATSASYAGEGHDHGEKPSMAASTNPRFIATSDQFELVGVLDAKTIALYLDHSATNEPVKKATLTLDIDGKPLTVKPISDGVFEAALPAPLKPGTMAVSATLTTGSTTDLLAGELDLHDASPKIAAHGGWADKVVHQLPLIGGLLTLLAICWFAFKRFARRTKRTSL
jgi:hypothetical protein